jgi:hypothetical protein
MSGSTSGVRMPARSPRVKVCPLCPLSSDVPLRLEALADLAEAVGDVPLMKDLHHVD